LDVLLALKRLADIEVRYAKDSSQRGYRVQSRHATGVGMSYQRFLSLAFFVLIPPDRARTVYELEVGRTLVWGHFQEGIFVATDNQEHPTAAWFIHLQPEDYKTGAAYGEYWGSIPNESFGDGTCFYDYIIAGYRSCVRFSTLITRYFLCSGMGNRCRVTRCMPACATFFRSLHPCPSRLKSFDACM
jgi:hypothetical protein